MPSTFSLSITTVLVLFSQLAFSSTLNLHFGNALLNSTDDYLLDLRIGSKGNAVRLAPALGLKETAILSTKTCTPPKEKNPKEQCMLYRNLVFDAGKSTSFEEGGDDFEWGMRDYEIYMKGSGASDKFVGKDINGKDVPLGEMEFALVDQCNTTSSFLGLGKDSNFLETLVRENKISSRSYGVHFGVDIKNHPMPVRDPSWEEEEKKAPDHAYRAGNGRRDIDPNFNYDIGKFPGRPSHAFPGSLTLGGFDKSKIDERYQTIVGPLGEDGAINLEMTDFKLINGLLYSPYDLWNSSRRVIIDSMTPHIHLPWALAETMRDLIGAGVGLPGHEYLYSANYWDKWLPTINMTLKVPGENGSETTLSLPPSIWWMKIGIMRDFKPTNPEKYYQFQAPLRGILDRTDDPIILGRAFLKSVYLYVNHDTSQFSLSQVAFANKTAEYIEVGPDVTDIGAPALGLASISDSDSDPANKDGSKNSADGEEEEGGSKAGLYGGIAGGVIALLVIAGVFFLRRRRQNENAGAAGGGPLKPLTSNDYQPQGGRMELDANATATATAVQMQPLKSPTTVGTAGPLPEKKPVPGNFYAPPSTDAVELYAPPPTISAPGTPHLGLQGHMSTGSSFSHQNYSPSLHPQQYQQGYNNYSQAPTAFVSELPGSEVSSQHTSYIPPPSPSYQPQQHPQNYSHQSYQQYPPPPPPPAPVELHSESRPVTPMTPGPQTGFNTGAGLNSPTPVSVLSGYTPSRPPQGPPMGNGGPGQGGGYYSYQ